MSDLVSKRYPELATCESTQDEVRKLLKNLSPKDNDLHWIVSAEQTKGRGRQGSIWQTTNNASAHLITSVGFQNEELDALGPLISLVAGHALYRAIIQFSIRENANFFLKWPNDLYAFTSSSKSYPVKVAGILAERRAKQGTVIGFGVNLTWNPELENRQTGCLSTYIEHADHDTLRTKLIQTLENSLLDLLKEYLKNPKPFAGSFIQDLRQSSMRLLFEMPEINITGYQVKPLSINNDGSLEVVDLNTQSRATLR